MWRLLSLLLFAALTFAHVLPRRYSSVPLYPRADGNTTAPGNGTAPRHYKLGPKREIWLVRSIKPIDGFLAKGDEASQIDRPADEKRNLMVFPTQLSLWITGCKGNGPVEINIYRKKDPAKDESQFGINYIGYPNGYEGTPGIYGKSMDVLEREEMAELDMRDKLNSSAPESLVFQQAVPLGVTYIKNVQLFDPYMPMSEQESTSSLQRRADGDADIEAESDVAIKTFLALNGAFGYGNTDVSNELLLPTVASHLTKFDPEMVKTGFNALPLAAGAEHDISAQEAMFVKAQKQWMLETGSDQGKKIEKPRLSIRTSFSSSHWGDDLVSPMKTGPVAADFIFRDSPVSPNTPKTGSGGDTPIADSPTIPGNMDPKKMVDTQFSFGLGDKSGDTISGTTAVESERGNSLMLDPRGSGSSSKYPQSLGLVNRGSALASVTDLSSWTERWKTSSVDAIEPVAQRLAPDGETKMMYSGLDDDFWDDVPESTAKGSSEAGDPDEVNKAADDARKGFTAPGGRAHGLFGIGVGVLLPISLMNIDSDGQTWIIGPGATTADKQAYAATVLETGALVAGGTEVLAGLAMGAVKVDAAVAGGITAGRAILSGVGIASGVLAIGTSLASLIMGALAVVNGERGPDPPSVGKPHEVLQFQFYGDKAEENKQDIGDREPSENPALNGYPTYGAGALAKILDIGQFDATLVNVVFNEGYPITIPQLAEHVCVQSMVAGAEKDGINHCKDSGKLVVECQGNLGDRTQEQQNTDRVGESMDGPMSLMKPNDRNIYAGYCQAPYKFYMDKNVDVTIGHKGETTKVKASEIEPKLLSRDNKEGEFIFRNYPGPQTFKGFGVQLTNVPSVIARIVDDVDKSGDKGSLTWSSGPDWTPQGDDGMFRPPRKDFSYPVLKDGKPTEPATACFSTEDESYAICLPQGAYTKQGDIGIDFKAFDKIVFPAEDWSITLPALPAQEIYNPGVVMPGFGSFNPSPPPPNVPKADPPKEINYDAAADQASFKDSLAESIDADGKDRVIFEIKGPAETKAKYPLACFFDKKDFKGAVMCRGEGGGDLPEEFKKKIASYKQFSSSVAMWEDEYAGDLTPTRQFGDQEFASLESMELSGSDEKKGMNDKVVAVYIGPNDLASESQPE